MMKTIKKMTLIAVMFMTTFSYAEKKVKSNAIAYSKIAVVEFDHAKKGQKLYVKDESGIILHSEKVENNGSLSKVFDLKQLENGKYTVELDKDFEVIIKPLEIINNTVFFFKDEERKIFKPVMKIDNDRLLVSQMTLESNPVEVEIYYGDSLIYSEHIKDEKTMNRVYKLSSIETGDYHAVLKSDGRTYTKHFKL